MHLIISLKYGILETQFDQMPIVEVAKAKAETEYHQNTLNSEIQ